MNGTQIIFNGVNNILHCEENVKLENTIINFGGNNGLVYLGKNRNVYMLGVNLYNDSVFYMGRNSYINGKITVVLSEQKHCFIGGWTMRAFMDAEADGSEYELSGLCAKYG